MFTDLARLWSLARKIEDLLKLQRDVHVALDLLHERVTKLDARLTKIEIEQAFVVSEARSAAASASTIVATSIISEAVTRLTRLESRTEQLTNQHSPADMQNS